MTQRQSRQCRRPKTWPNWWADSFTKRCQSKVGLMPLDMEPFFQGKLASRSDGDLKFPRNRSRWPATVGINRITEVLSLEQVGNSDAFACNSAKASSAPFRTGCRKST